MKVPWEALALTLAVVGCGVRSPPMPQNPADARPAAGDPNQVPTGEIGGQIPPALQNIEHEASFPDGGPVWLLKQAADAGATAP